MMEHLTIKTTGWRFVAMMCVIVAMAGCYYDVEEVIYPNGCDTNDITYSQDVRNILESNCLTCHDALSQNGNVNLEGYDNVKIYVDNGKLLGTIRHEDGFSAMPQGASQLASCTINKIQAWVDAGAPNN